MYKIIGADGREYGPVTQDQLRQWVTEGRANAQTKAQTEGSAEWKALGALPEFAGLFAGTPPVPPPIRTANAERLATEILARDYVVQIGDCIGRGWSLVKADFWLFVSATTLTVIISSASIIGLVLGGPTMGGLYVLMLKRLRGQPATFGDLFIGYSVAFLPLMLAHIVSQLLTTVGLLCCLLPGIYLAVGWVFTLPLIIDKRLDFWPAMELSRKVVSKHWWTIFGLLLLSGLVAACGVLLCCIGILAALPIGFASLACAYENIFGERPAQAV